MEAPAILEGPGSFAKRKAIKDAALKVPAVAGKAAVDFFDNGLDKMHKMQQAVPANLDPAVNPKTKKPFTQVELNDALAAREAETRQKVKDESAGKKVADQDKPLWSKASEAEARIARKNGGVIPEGWINAAPTNVGGNPALMNDAQKEQFRTEFGDTAPKKANGLTNDDAWAKLFPKNTQNWTDTKLGGVDGRFRIGQYEAQANNGRFVTQNAPADLVLDQHFGGKWTGASPEDRAAMVRKEAGLPAPGWQTPSMTAASVGAGSPTQGSRLVPDLSTPTGVASIPTTVRTVSAPQYQGGGFSTTPAMPAMVSTVPTPDVAMPPMPGINPGA